MDLGSEVAGAGILFAVSATAMRGALAVARVTPVRWTQVLGSSAAAVALSLGLYASSLWGKPHVALSLGVLLVTVTLAIRFICRTTVVRALFVALLWFGFHRWLFWITCERAISRMGGMM
jgi:hypothetical protein